MSLPILTTIDDVGSIVSYLKTKPTGASLAEAKAVVKKQVLDPRKITAFTFWEIVSKEGDRLKLSKRGWDLARNSRPDTDIFGEILGSIPPYRSVLEWAFHQKMATITNVDVAAHWHEHHTSDSGEVKETTLKDQAVCFFHLSQAAGIGKLFIGRRGQQTRLEINKAALEAFVQGGPSEPPWSSPTGVEEVSPETEGSELESSIPETKSTREQSAHQEPDGHASRNDAAQQLRVFISHGKNMEIVEQVETMLGMADIEYEIAVAEETPAIPVPEKVFEAMRRCTAAVIVVSVEEGSKNGSGDYTVNQNVLIEIGAAFVLYSRKVVLVWDKRIHVPSNLQGLYRCEFEGDELSWKAGMKLMKAIKEFKK